MENVLSSSAWSPGKKIIFRFFFLYFVLYIFPFPIGWFPFTDFLLSGYYQEWGMQIIGFTGKKILLLDYEKLISPAGSGDTTYNYIAIFLFAMIAAVGTVVWSVVDRKSANYEKLLYWFIILVRYYLAIILLSYGFAKIIKTQFPFPTLDRLNQPLGNFSPMGLLWTFMGYSTAYNLFAGLGEAIGGFLLFFRRTRVLGALILITVMANVVVLNFSYDVPVKLFSAHLLAMSILLLLPDAERLMKFFFLNQRVDPLCVQPAYSSRTRTFYFLGKGSLIVFVITMNIVQGLQVRERYADFFGDGPKPPLYGTYDVETFVLGGDTLRAGMNDQRRWKVVNIHIRGGAMIEYLDGAKIYTPLLADTLKRTIKLDDARPEVTHNFIYQPDASGLLLKGFLYQQDSVIAILKKKHAPEFLLTSRGFHWINEYPLNR